MYSVENFYYILNKNLYLPTRFNAHYFYPFGSTGSSNIIRFGVPIDAYFDHHIILNHDQEPLLDNSLNYVLPTSYYTNTRCKILSNSEHSVLKKQKCQQLGMIDMYYFYHGFASLYWFSDWKYLPNTNSDFTSTFISLNNLTVNDRSYRLLLVSKMIDKNLLEKGLVSLNLKNQGHGDWSDELNNPNTKLPKNQLDFIHKQLAKINFKSLVVDTDNPTGALSAGAGQECYELQQKALWHVVSETVFYYDKLHLTEKIFKPIATKRPFILVAAPGNLKYLKYYGFKTFDKWIDESYDDEYNDNIRLEKITNELEKLCKLNRKQLALMHCEMKDILDFNFNHFYSDFKCIITKELLDNFKSATGIYNNGLINCDHRVAIENINFHQMYKLLTQ